jgi:hypothetical protein
MTVALTFAVSGTPRVVHAEWRLAAYTGTASTTTNTLRIVPAAGAPIVVGNVSYEGQAFRAPI